MRQCLSSAVATLQSSGNDIFYRNPSNVNENLFVDVSSPSSSNYASVEDLGPPEAAARRTLDQVWACHARASLRRSADCRGVNTNPQTPHRMDGCCMRTSKKHGAILLRWRHPESCIPRPPQHTLH